MAKKQCSTPHCKKLIGHIGNCSGKEAHSFTRNAVQNKTHFRRPPGAAPRGKVWNTHVGKWVTHVILPDDSRIAADSLVAMASPVYVTNDEHVAQPQIVPPASPDAPQTVPSAFLVDNSFASLFQQLGAQMDAQMARIVALESKVGVIN